MSRRRDSPTGGVKKISIRACFSIRGEIRPFFWATLVEDGSIYFGVPHHPGQEVDEIGPLPFAKSPLADRVARALLQQGHTLLKSDHIKYSLHGSGKFHQSKRPTVECFAPSKRKCISLMAIRHRPLELIAPGSRGQGDLVIPADHLIHLGIGSMIYLKRADLPDPPVIRAKSSQFAIFEVHQHEFGAYDLCVAVYADPNKLSVALGASLVLVAPVSRNDEIHIGRDEPREPFIWLTDKH